MPLFRFGRDQPDARGHERENQFRGYNNQDAVQESVLVE
jgi:hypothetical protein